MTSISGTVVGVMEADAAIIRLPEHVPFIAFAIRLRPRKDRLHGDRVNVNIYGRSIEEKVPGLKAGKLVTVCGKVSTRAYQSADGRWYAELLIAGGSVEVED